MITEWGATGHWECKNTTWDRLSRPIAPKKLMITIVDTSIILLQIPGNVLVHLFLWGQKQENTHLVWTFFRK